MAEPEDKLLEDYFQKISTEAEGISDIKLNVAIHRGMQQSGRTRIPLRKGYSVAIFALVAIALFIIVPWVNPTTKSEHAQLPPQNWGALEVFRPVAEDNMTVKSALDTGMVKQIDDSTIEVDGLEFTINGLIADRRGVIVLYTFQNNKNQKVQPLGLTTERDPVSLNNNSGSTSFSPYVRESDVSPGESHIIEQIVWDKNLKELPEQLTITLSVIPVSVEKSILNKDFRTIELSIAIPMDVDKDYFEGKVVDLNDNISISGQKINIDEVYIGPTGIYMRELYSEDNTMEIFSMVSPKLLIGDGDNQEELRLARGSFLNEGIQMRIYHNNNRRLTDPIRLEVEGITALDKSKLELVIDTEQQKIIKANDQFSISVLENVKGEGYFMFSLLIPKKDGQISSQSGFSLDGNFTDAMGNDHRLEASNVAYPTDYIEDAKGSTIISNFKVREEKLPQPLSFTINSYPNDILEHHSIRIR